MSVDFLTLAAILAMAIVTYLTRIGGFALVRRLDLDRRGQALLATVPGCVLVAVIAPAVLASGPADLLAAAITLLAALRLPLAAVVAIGVGSAALLRHLLP